VETLVDEHDARYEPTSAIERAEKMLSEIKSLGKRDGVVKILRDPAYGPVMDTPAENEVWPGLRPPINPVTKCVRAWASCAQHLPGRRAWRGGVSRAQAGGRGAGGGRAERGCCSSPPQRRKEGRLTPLPACRCCSAYDLRAMMEKRRKQQLMDAEWRRMQKLVNR
jgi:hypothetical protein